LIFFFKCTHIFTSSVLLFPVYSAQRICESVKCNFSLLSFSLPSPVKYCRLVCGCCWELASLLFCSWEYQIGSLRARQRKKLFWSRNYLLWWLQSWFFRFTHCLPKQGCKNELEWSGSARVFTCASCPLRAIVSWNKSGGL